MFKFFTRPLTLALKSNITFCSIHTDVRFFSSSLSTMADLKVDLTAPNGKKITLPTGLFINNEFVKASSGQKITSINPS